MYRGRFAPSPTGPLHFGSLVAALGSCLEARRRGGQWLVRVEDIDPPRESAGAADSILRSLERLGFEWDEAVLYQRMRVGAYAEAIDALNAAGIAYRCSCTRSEIRAAAGESEVYAGTCRNGPRNRRRRTAVRVRTEADPVAFFDRLQGHISQSVSREVGDFIVRRRDGLFAYHLAVVIDDSFQRITDVVRGADLLDSTPRQIYLQRLLGLPTPGYAHLPVVLAAEGQKLSKQTGATPVERRSPGVALHAALEFLGQRPPGALAVAEPRDIWEWAGEHWRLDAVPSQNRHET